MNGNTFIVFNLIHMKGLEKCMLYDTTSLWFYADEMLNKILQYHFP